MNFSEAVNEVLRMTGRPDKAVTAKRAVNAAISFICTEGNFVYDLREETVTINSALLAQTIQYDSITRFRKLAYLKVAGSTRLLQIVTADKIFDCGRQLTDVAYLAGDGIKINLSSEASEMQVGYYEYPEQLDGTLVELPEQFPLIQTHWTLLRMPYVVIHKAASDVFFEAGSESEANTQYRMFSAAFESARRDMKHGVDYG